MKTILLVNIIILLIWNAGNAQQSSEKYLGQVLPGSKPIIFAPALVSLPDQYEYGSVFSKDGKEFFYGVDMGGRAEIRYIKRDKAAWAKPEKLVSGDVYSYNDPFLSPDQTKLFFISDRAMDGVGPKKDYDIWYVQRNGGGWSKPINAGNNINSQKNEYYMSFSAQGTMYFSSNTNAAEDNKMNYDIYASRYVNGKFQPPVKMPESINTTGYEADVFVAPDESYVIFCANRPDGIGKGDLYISFKKKDGAWTDSKSMGTDVNTSQHELCPFVSPDGKYFFYTSNKDIYWVDAGIIEGLK